MCVCVYILGVITEAAVVYQSEEHKVNAKVIYKIIISEQYRNE